MDTPLTDEGAAPPTRLRSFSPIFPVRDMRRALAHHASLGFEVTPYANGGFYGFADRDGVGLHLSLEAGHGHDGEHDHEHVGSAYLYAEGAKDPRRADVVLAGYRRHVTLTGEELDRLADIIRARPLVLTAWAVCTGRRTPAEAMAAAAETRALAGTLASRARKALAS